MKNLRCKVCGQVGRCFVIYLCPSRIKLGGELVFLSALVHGVVWGLGLVRCELRGHLFYEFGWKTSGKE